jgi:hypothetical protein
MSNIDESLVQMLADAESAIKELDLKISDVAEFLKTANYSDVNIFGKIANAERSIKGMAAARSGLRHRRNILIDTIAVNVAERNLAVRRENQQIQKEQARSKNKVGNAAFENNKISELGAYIQSQNLIARKKREEYKKHLEKARLKYETEKQRANIFNHALHEIQQIAGGEAIHKIVVDARARAKQCSKNVASNEATTEVINV